MLRDLSAVVSSNCKVVVTSGLTVDHTFFLRTKLKVAGRDVDQPVHKEQLRRSETANNAEEKRCRGRWPQVLRIRGT